MSIPSLLGQIIFFNHHRGFGRIRCDEIDETVFVHFSAIEGESRVLVPHELVRFDYQENPKGPRATRVQRLSQRLRGNILQLKRGKGQVSALPGGQRFDFEIEDLIGGKEEETSPGVAVEFSPFDAHTAKELVIVDPALPSHSLVPSLTGRPSFSDLKDSYYQKPGAPWATPPRLSWGFICTELLPGSRKKIKSKGVGLTRDRPLRYSIRACWHRTIRQLWRS